jgi:DNA polymerase elongation subunit (family B)
VDRVDKILPAKLRIHYIDIEENENHEIISISVFDNFLNKAVTFVWREDLKPSTEQKEYGFPSGYTFHATVHYYNTKAKMLQDYIKFTRDTDPDILTGWYFLDFDMTELINQINSIKGLSSGWLSPLGRCYVRKQEDVLQGKPPVACAGRVLRDMIKDYRALQRQDLPDKTLEAVAQEELKEGKKTFSHSINWLWRNDLNTLIEYNAKDSILVYRIDKKCKILDYYDSVRRWVGCDWENLHSETQMWDIYILRKLHNKVILPTKESIKFEKIVGAKVIEPKKGIHEWVVCIDARSLYPSNICTFNLSPETVVKGNPEPGRDFYSLPNGDRFYKTPMGLFPSILLELDEERNKYKAEMKKHLFGTDEYDVWDHLQTAIKCMKNALYGATLYSRSHKSFRLVSKEIGETTTFVGREVITFVQQKLEEYGFEVIYGDTDSLFVFSRKSNLLEVVEEIKSLLVKINEDLKDLVERLGGDRNNCYLFIEPKQVYRYFLMYLKRDEKGASKKNYWYRVLWNEGREVDEIELVGEGRKSHHSKMTKQLLKNVCRCLLGLEPREKIKVYIRQCREILSQDEPDYEFIGMPKGIGQNLNTYKTDNPWVRGCRYSNNYLGTEFGMSDKPKIVYVRDSPKGYPKTDVVAFVSNRDLPKGFVVDAEKMFEKGVSMKLEQVLEAANIDMDELIHNQTKLDAF